MKTFKATTSKEISAREREHARLVRALAPQGMVLLENDGALPLTKGTVALYGAGARQTVKGGTGSGDVNARSVVNVEQGLLNAGFTIVTDPWLDEYDRLTAEARKAHQAAMQKRIEAGEHPIGVYFSMPYVDPDTPSIDPEAAPADTAIYVIPRNSGEGKDRTPTPGDYFLSAKEAQDLQVLRGGYEKVIVLLNVGGVLDMKDVLAAKPNAVLLISQSGASGGDAVADALLGITPPSGRLTDTWPLDYKDYPSSATFGANDGNTLEEPYQEGIFVGYRWFDAAGMEVAYPFGFGRNYTDFTMEVLRAGANANGVNLRVKVTNTGAFAGREVVQVYVSAPAGKLPKPYQELCGFAKTHLLEPGESQAINISFPLKNMASYSEELAAWVLEAGDYVVRVGRHSRDTEPAAVVKVFQLVKLEQMKNLRQPTKLTEQLIPTGRAEEELPAGVPVIALRCAEIIAETHVYAEADKFDTAAPAETVTMAEVRSGKYTVEQMAAQLTNDELAHLCVGEFGDQSQIGNAGKDAPGAAGQTTRSLGYRGVGSLVLADGPAGLRLTPHFRADKDGNLIGDNHLFALGGAGDPLESLPIQPGETDYYQYCTAIPIATMIAQSWNVNMAYQLGKLVGREMLEFGVHSWLAPGMNIHRNPLCGRNFEYYSEDPLIAGMIAAADTAGVQSNPGVGTTPKHYACNNQEDDRNYSDSILSERALREIYLRGFEICVRSAQPMYLMSSYNFINGIHAANNRDTLTTTLREEWGFKGLVMTDWGTTGGGSLMPPKGEDSLPALCIAAGNDLIESGNEGDVKDILASLAGETDHPVTIDSLRLCASRILRVIAGSSLYEDAEPWTAKWETEWFVKSE